MRIELKPGCPKFAAPDAGIHLDIYTPQATIEEITPHVQEGLDVGWIIMIDDPAPVVDVHESESGTWRDEDGRFTSDSSEDADGKPEGANPRHKLSDNQCAGTTKNGKKCKKKAIEGSAFCPFHIPEEELAELDAALAAEAPEVTSDDVRSD